MAHRASFSCVRRALFTTWLTDRSSALAWACSRSVRSVGNQVVTTRPVCSCAPFVATRHSSFLCAFCLVAAPIGAYCGNGLIKTTYFLFY